MKKIFLVLIIICVVPISANADNSEVFRSKAKYMKYVGTYFLVDETMTINSDGTFSVVPGSMYSLNARQGRRITPLQGAWRETANNELVITGIRFSTDSTGSEYESVGLIVKLTATLTFDEPVQGRCLAFTVNDLLFEPYLPDQNPITDVPLASPILEDGRRGYRLEAGYPDSLN